MKGSALLLAAAAISQTVSASDVPAPPQTPRKNIVIAVDKNGTITLNGTTVTCEQMNAFFEKMARKSNGKIMSLPCHEYPFVGDKKSN